MSEIGTLAWAKEHALFGCVGCSDDRSLPAEDLRIDADGDRICQDCFSDQCEGDGSPLPYKWHDLPPFEPFRGWEAHIQRALEEIDSMAVEP